MSGPSRKNWPVEFTGQNDADSIDGSWALSSHTKAVFPRRFAEVSLALEPDGDRVGGRSADLCLAPLSPGSLEFVDSSVRYPLAVKDTRYNR